MKTAFINGKVLGEEVHIILPVKLEAVRERGYPESSPTWLAKIVIPYSRELHLKIMEEARINNFFHSFSFPGHPELDGVYYVGTIIMGESIAFISR